MTATQKGMSTSRETDVEGRLIEGLYGSWHGFKSDWPQHLSVGGTRATLIVGGYEDICSTDADFLYVTNAGELWPGPSNIVLGSSIEPTEFAHEHEFITSVLGAATICKVVLTAAAAFPYTERRPVHRWNPVSMKAISNTESTLIAPWEGDRAPGAEDATVLMNFGRRRNVRHAPPSWIPELTDAFDLQMAEDLGSTAELGEDVVVLRGFRARRYPQTSDWTPTELSDSPAPND